MTLPRSQSRDGKRVAVIPACAIGEIARSGMRKTHGLAQIRRADSLLGRRRPVGFAFPGRGGTLPG
jgi:hypothetical protein